MRRIFEAGLAGMLAVMALAQPASASDADTIKVSVSGTGEAGNLSSYEADIATGGRYVAFRSGATNLVPGDTNRRHDVFVHDLSTGAVSRVSVSSTGAQQSDYATGPAISADGRYVAFGSGDASLAPGAPAGGIWRHDRLTGETIQIAALPNQSLTAPAISGDGNVVGYTSTVTDYCDPHTSICGWNQVFVHDVAAGTTEMVSVSTSGERAKGGHANTPSLSYDGRYVVFESSAWTLAPGEGFELDPTIDAFLRDRATGTTTRISRNVSGLAPGGHSRFPTISADASTIAFTSYASDLVPGDTNGKADIFVFERASETITRASVTAGGAQSNGHSDDADLSADGRFVAFDTSASNLIPFDTNGRQDIVVRDRTTGAISFGTRFDGDGQPDNGSWRPSISGDGRLTVYDSTATDIIQNDGNFWEDVFVLIAYPWKTGRAVGIDVMPPGFGFGDTGTIRRSAPRSVEGGWQEVDAPGVRARVPSTSVRITMDDVRSAASVGQAHVAATVATPAIRVEGVRASAQASCAGSSGMASIAYLEIDGSVVFAGPDAPAPNTMVPLPGGFAVLNEQVAVPGGVRVNAVRVTTSGATVTLASALATIDRCPT